MPNPIRQISRRFAAKQAACAGLLATAYSSPLRAEEGKRRVAVTIDDGPATGVGNDLDQFASISARIRESFVADDVPAIMFVNEKQFHVEGQRDARIKVLDAWLESGLEVGNHTYSHRNLRDVDLPFYFDDIVKGEVISRPLLKKHGQKLIWFRYPFLGTASGEKARAVESFLSERDYRIAPVTVDYADYAFARNYSRLVRAGSTSQADEIVQQVMKAIDAAYDQSEKQSREILGYELPLVLLIHCNELNARNLPESLARMRDRGYEFISLDQAMQDIAYQTPNLPPGTMGGGFFRGLYQTLKENSGK